MDTKKQTLGTFYASPMGQLCLRYAEKQLDLLWDDWTDKRLLTIGYATPYFSYFQKKSLASITEIVFEGEPEKTLSLKTSENSFPFKCKTFDRIFSAATLERVSFPKAFLQEVRRVLRPDGSFILMTINKRHHLDSYKNSAFAAGTLYTAAQVKELLEENMFRVQKQKTCLFLPPDTYKQTPYSDVFEQKLQTYAFFNGAFILTKATVLNALEVPVSHPCIKNEGGLSLLPAYERTENGKVY